MMPPPVKTKVIKQQRTLLQYFPSSPSFSASSSIQKSASPFSPATNRLPLTPLSPFQTPHVEEEPCSQERENEVLENFVSNSLKTRKRKTRGNRSRKGSCRDNLGDSLSLSSPVTPKDLGGLGGRGEERDGMLEIKDDTETGKENEDEEEGEFDEEEIRKIFEGEAESDEENQTHQYEEEEEEEEQFVGENSKRDKKERGKHSSAEYSRRKKLYHEYAIIKAALRHYKSEKQREVLTLQNGGRPGRKLIKGKRKQSKPKAKRTRPTYREIYGELASSIPILFQYVDVNTTFKDRESHYKYLTSKYHLLSPYPPEVLQAAAELVRQRKATQQQQQQQQQKQKQITNFGMEDTKRERKPETKDTVPNLSPVPRKETKSVFKISAILTPLQRPNRFSCLAAGPKVPLFFPSSFTSSSSSSPSTASRSPSSTSVGTPSALPESPMRFPESPMQFLEENFLPQTPFSPMPSFSEPQSSLPTSSLLPQLSGTSSTSVLPPQSGDKPWGVEGERSRGISVVTGGDKDAGDGLWCMLKDGIIRYGSADFSKLLLEIQQLAPETDSFSNFRDLMEEQSYQTWDKIVDPILKAGKVHLVLKGKDQAGKRTYECLIEVDGENKFSEQILPRLHIIPLPSSPYLFSPRSPPPPPPRWEKTLGGRGVEGGDDRKKDKLWNFIPFFKPLYLGREGYLQDVERDGI